MGYGGLSSFPFDYGGGPTDEETIYYALRGAVGVGGSATDDTGIDGLWRECRAAGLAAAASSLECAVAQAFPQIATEFIPVYEEELGIVPPENATDEDRRRAITEAYTAKAAENEVDLAVRLSKIDTRLSLPAIPQTKAKTVQFGKAFEPQDGVPTYGPTQKSSRVPNYSDDFFVRVFFTLATTMPTPVDLAIIMKAKRLLREILPSWVSFAIISSNGPFLLDTSPLDLTCLS